MKIINKYKYLLKNITKTDGGHRYIISEPNGNETKGFSSLSESELRKQLTKTLTRLNTNKGFFVNKNSVKTS